MSSTADRWFVPNKEYYDLTNDYALVCQPAVKVREAIMITDEAPSRINYADDTFLTEFVNYQPCYRFALEGRLVFADVNDEDPSHKETIYGEWAKEILTEKENEKTQTIKKELAKACADAFFPLDDDEDVSQNECERCAEGGLLADEGGLLTEPILSKLITSNVQEKEEILNIMSGQTQRPTKRPVIALINMIDSKRTTEVGETEGWVVGYDFIKELLIIKPFISKEGKHPLGGPWYGAVAQDGVSFSGSLQEFATAYIEFGETVGPSNKDDGFKMLVHTLTARWFGYFKKALETAYGAEFRDLFPALKAATMKIKNTMATIEFAAAQKNENERRAEIKTFSWMLSMINLEENNIRDEAVEAKERGQEKIAQNAAKLYEHIHKQIKAFNENPSMDLDF
ncbi:hypothetical protein MMC07_009167 [Pseudocyphellaria aurata]|nr:hypothetical protein [Pseudocyphellaria aurata]